MTDVGVWGLCPQPPPAAEGKVVWGQSPQLLAIFTIFNENNTFLGILKLKFLFKNIFLISLIIQNG